MADAPRVKICGLSRREDALAADALGADYLGVVLSAGYARSVDPADAARLLAGVEAQRVVVVVDEAPETVAAWATGVGADVIQLHGEEPPDQVRRLRALGSWRLWKAVRAAVPGDVEDAVTRYGAVVDALLVEGRRPGVVGGGGAQVDAGALGRLRDRVPEGLELVLAGGLTPDNVAAAVDRHAPDVVDVSSGVEVDRGRKDPDLLRSFVLAVRANPADAPHPSGERS